MTARTLVVAGSLLLASSPPTGASEPPAAELLRVAVQHFSNAEFARSVELLERARKLPAPAPVRARVQLYLGLNRAVLGEEAPARAAFREALAADPLLVLKPDEIKPTIVAVFDSVRTALTGEIAVTVDRPEAQVSIDGRVAGAAPLRLRIGIGAHQISARSGDGCHSATGRSVVGVNGKAELQLRLQPILAQGCGSSQAGPRRRIWTFVTAGVAVATLIAGIGVGASAQADYGEYQTIGDPRRGQELASSIESKDRAANTLFVIGGALALASTVLFFVEGRPSRASRGVRLELGPRAIALRY